MKQTLRILISGRRHERLEALQTFGPSLGHPQLYHRIANRDRFEAGPDREQGLAADGFEREGLDHPPGRVAVSLRQAPPRTVLTGFGIARSLEAFKDSR